MSTKLFRLSFFLFLFFWYWIIYFAKFPSCGKTKRPRMFLQAWQRLFILGNESEGKEVRSSSTKTCNLSCFFHYLCENRAVPNNEFRLKMKSEFITLPTTKMKLVRYRDVTWTKRTFHKMLKHELFLLKWWFFHCLLKPSTKALK